MYDLLIYSKPGTPVQQDQIVAPAAPVYQQTAVQPAPILPAQQAGVSGGQVATGGASVLAIVVCGFVCWYVVKHKNAKAMHMFFAFTLGALLAGSIVGVTVTNLANSGAGMTANMVGTVGSGPGR